MVDMLPRLKWTFRLSDDLEERVFPEGATGIPWLLLITGLGLVLACILMSRRELQPTKLARD